MSAPLRTIPIGSRFRVAGNDWTLLELGDVAWAERHAPDEPARATGPVGHGERDRFSPDAMVEVGWADDGGPQIDTGTKKSGA